VSSQFGRSAELSAREFNSRVADPALFSGGGSVAALVGANACALSLLVARLAQRRRINSANQVDIAAAIAAIEAHTDAFYRAADTDLVVLDNLLGAQRGLKEGSTRAGYADALCAAARSPLELAERAATLIAVIARLVPFASRFTVSDLGAAAALAGGAARAALLTVDVNVALLRDELDLDAATLDELAERAAHARQTVDASEAAVLAAAADAISGTRHA
jgi:formiminotetrahydrofolate cyclodeaminase